MSLCPFNGRSNRYNFHRDFFDNSLTPYWANRALNLNFNVGADVGEFENTEKKFAVKLDVSHFKPEELKVNLEGNVLTVEGQHEVKTEHGYTKRSFTRQFSLPKNSDLSAIHSHLSADGHLSIDVPKDGANNTSARAIPIHTPTGQIIPNEATKQ